MRHCAAAAIDSAWRAIPAKVRPHSLKRRLLLSVAVALFAFFGITVLVLDSLFQSIADRSLGELLDAQMLALIAAAEPDRGGGIVSTAASFEVRLQTPGSGLYAEIRRRNGGPIWRSPSLAGTFLEFSSNLQPGERRLDFRNATRGGGLAIARRGISWERGALGPQQLIFTVASSLKPYEDQLRRFRRQLFGGFVVLALLLVATLALLLRWVMSPVGRLEREISEVELGQRAALGADYPREIGGVAKNLNTLLDSERRRIARYRDTLGNLAHSLKTPLAVIRAALGGREVAAPVIEAEVQRMTGIIEHQLKRAAARGGNAIVQTPVAVLPMARELKPALAKVYAHKDLLIEIAVDPDLQFLGDSDDLLEALGNLLENACKWCRGHVKLTGRLDAQAPPTQRLLLRVEDDGPGIPEAERVRVLQRGQRADESTPGHGLGLAMVCDTVALYGGCIAIDTAELGGARVELRLPGRNAV